MAAGTSLKYALRIAGLIFILGAFLGASAAPGANPPAEKKKKPEATKEPTVMEVGQFFEFLRDPEIVSEVNTVGAAVAKAYHAPVERYRFWILKSPELNAFTTPSGDIFIYSGTLARLRAEDELAALLAHEMAHREADHFGEIQKKNALIAIPTIAALILSKGEEAVVAGAIAVASAYQLHFSRQMEEEADLMAVNALKKTAWDPMGMVGALRVIEEADRMMPMDVPDHLSTHPPLEVRKASLESILGRPLQDISWSPAAGAKWMRSRALLLGLTVAADELLKRRQAQETASLSAEAHHLNGLALLKAGKHREAMDELEAARLARDDDAYLWADLGAAAFLLGDKEKAASYLETARKALPDYAYPLFFLAEMEAEAGRLPQAAILYQKAIDAKPEIPEAYSKYSTILESKGKRGEAAYCMGVAALLNGRFREAQTLLEEADRALGANPYWKEKIRARQAILR